MPKVGCLVLMLLAASPALSAELPEDGTADWTVSEINPIKQIYVGQTTAEGTELVFEQAAMHFYCNQRLYGCIFINGKIAGIAEYNSADSYVRARVQLGGDEDLVVYSGTVKAPEKLDPHNHAALWRAFVRSPHQPFKARLSQLPKWYDRNPIKDRKKPVEAGASEDPGPGGTYPYLKPDERPAKAKRALDPTTGDRERFYCVWGLAISGYCREGADALVVIATDPKQEETTRGYAAMGLSNYTSTMPADVRAAARRSLQLALKAEKEKLPDGVMRTMIAWGDADLLAETLGEKLNGFPLEIEILTAISSRENGVDRLVKLGDRAGDVKTQEGWYRRNRIGWALIARRDKRGVDLLIECLSVKEPWPVANSTPAAQESTAASFRQCLHNTFAFIAGIIDEDFGYPRGGNWKPALAQAIPKMTQWWQENRERFSFEEALSETVPAIQPGKPLTKRQARVLAAKLATDAFARQVPDNAEGPSPRVRLEPTSFDRVHQEGDRWLLHAELGRFSASVSFKLDGTDEKVTALRHLR